jgi:hypothetical protein
MGGRIKSESPGGFARIGQLEKSRPRIPRQLGRKIGGKHSANENARLQDSLWQLDARLAMLGKCWPTE